MAVEKMTGSRKLFPFKFHILGLCSYEVVRCALALELEVQVATGLVAGVQDAGVGACVPFSGCRG